MPTSPEPPEFYTTQECMTLFRLSHDAICDLFKKKAIPAIKIAGQWRVHRTVIENLITQATGAGERNRSPEPDRELR